jgi:hypothetical protein
VTGIRKVDRHAIKVHHNVLALYCSLSYSGADFKVKIPHSLREAQKPSTLDFICDVKIATAKALHDQAISNDYFAWALDPDRCLMLPQLIQVVLGVEYEDRRLDKDGDYAILYYQVKNELRRRDIPVEEGNG